MKDAKLKMWLPRIPDLRDAIARGAVQAEIPDAGLRTFYDAETRTGWIYPARTRLWMIFHPCPESVFEQHVQAAAQTYRDLAKREREHFKTNH